MSLCQLLLFTGLGNLSTAELKVNYESFRTVSNLPRTELLMKRPDIRFYDALNFLEQNGFIRVTSNALEKRYPNGKCRVTLDEYYNVEATFISGDYRHLIFNDQIEKIPSLTKFLSTYNLIEAASI